MSETQESKPIKCANSGREINSNGQGGSIFECKAITDCPKQLFFGKARFCADGEELENAVR
jgi:hypothetical protein